MGKIKVIIREKSVLICNKRVEIASAISYTVRKRR